MELVLWVRFGGKKEERQEENCIKHLVYAYVLYMYSLFNLDKNPDDEYFYTHCSHQEPEVQKY